MFAKGQSGNPAGRPKGNHEVKTLAKKHTKEAFERVLELMRSDDQRVSLAAAQEVLNRAHGKPAQAVTGEGGEGPIEHDMSIRVIFGRRGDDGA